MPFTVYKSSAGSGKTYTLVKEYLKLLISNPGNYRHILAITFTNKAANEMKERIIDYLIQLSSPNTEKGTDTLNYLLPEIHKETKLSENLVRESAGKALELILHDYSNFSIGTIDSFVHRIVRTFAYDLHLPLNFEVELDAEMFIRQAVDILISRVGADKKLTKVLVSFVMSRIEEEKSWNIENDFQTMAGNLLDEEGQLHIEKIKQLSLDDFMQIDQKIISFVKSFRYQISHYAANAMKLIHDNNIEAGDFFQGKRGIYKYLNELARGNYKNIIPGSYTQRTIQEDKWYTEKTPESQKAAIDSVKETIRHIFSKIQEITDQDYKTYSILSIIQRNLYSLAVLTEIEKLIIDIKEQRNIVHISEFNRRIAEIVLNEPVPFIYERLGEKYRYFLIDEFQDTSILQWHNLLPLIDNSLAANNLNLVVGDAKQAIYRWRNGDYEQFVHLPSIRKKQDDPILTERENSLKRNYVEQPLNQNFRSCVEIVEFNNNFFSYVSGLIPEQLRDTYKDHRQGFIKNKTGGYIRIDLLQTKNAEDFRKENLNRVYDYIKENLDLNYQLSDIAVLCRSNNEASAIATHLVEKGLSVVSPESLLLGNSARLNFIMSIIKLLINTEDKISQANALIFLWYTSGIQCTALSYLLMQINAEAPPDNHLKTTQQGHSFLKLLNDHGYHLNISYLKKLGAYDLCEELIRIFKLNNDNDPYLEFFLDAVYLFTTAQNPDIFDLNDWWEENKNKLSVVASDKNDAIRVMTIHKAKGLAFPVVIYPFADQRLKAAKKSLWINLLDNEAGKLKTASVPVIKELQNTAYANHYEREMELSMLDMVNLLYVVMTRPGRQLYIITKYAKPEKEIKSIPQIFSSYLHKEGLLSEEVTMYTFGKISPNDKMKSIRESIGGQTMISERWQNKVLLSRMAPGIWDIEHPRSGVEYGNLVHSILSQIKSEEDIETVLEAYLQKGLIPGNAYQEIHAKTKQLVNHPDLKQFFRKDAKVRSESDVITPDGHVIRPDRFVLIGKTAFIIDYKTGKPDDKHRQQLNMYESIIQNMGYAEIQKVLVYIDKEIKVIIF